MSTYIDENGDKVIVIDSEEGEGVIEEAVNGEGEVTAVEDSSNSEKKNAVWNYNAVGHLLTVNFPDGLKWTFNLSGLVNGMSFSVELMFQYGMKQWLMTNTGALKTSKEKLESMKIDFNDFVAKGLQLSVSGVNITITGRERLNGTGLKENNAIGKMAKEIAGTVSLQGLFMKKAIADVNPNAPRFTEEDQKKLDELILEAATQVR